MNDRKAVPDILKGVAVLLMIQVHLTELFANQGFYDGIYGKISLFLGGPPAAPVFMAVMGYFIMNGSASPARSIIRGIQLILLGLALNIALNAHALVRIIAGNLAADPLSLIFGVDILFLAGLSVIVVGLLRPLLKKHFLLAALLACAVAALTPIVDRMDAGGQVSGYIFAYIGGSLRWSYFPLFPWLAYPLAGAAFFVFEKRYLLKPLSVKRVVPGLLILLAVLLSTGYFMAPIATDLHRYYHHGILFFLWTSLFLVVWVVVFWLLCQWLRNSNIMSWFAWIGRNVTIFYVVQWIIIGNLGTWLYKSVAAPWLIVYFAGILLVTSLVSWAYSAIKASLNKDKLF